MTVHQFTRSLAESHEYAEAPWWEEVYRKAFSSYEGMVDVRSDGAGQRLGIDRHVALTNGRTITIDEKVRKKDYDDILLERWSDRGREKAGWMQKDLACDYIAYAFVPSQRCYLLPFQDLRRAWLRFGRQWIRTYRPVLAENEGWTTECVPVPISVLQEALRDVALIRWGRE